MAKGTRRNNGKKSNNPHAHANPELAQAMREFGRSSATDRHQLKFRKGTRAARRARALADY